MKKKANDRAKGNRIEKELQDVCEAHGCEVQRAASVVIWIPDETRPPRFIGGKKVPWLRPITKRVDLFGKFDLIVKCRGLGEFEGSIRRATLYVQTSTEWKTGEERAAMEGFAANPFEVVMMGRRPDRKPFEFARYDAGLNRWLSGGTMQKIVERYMARCAEADCKFCVRLAHPLPEVTK